VVTRFWFKDLPAAPDEAYLADIVWNWSSINRDAFRHLVREYGRPAFIASAKRPAPTPGNL
jgi:hypothetical protein